MQIESFAWHYTTAKSFLSIVRDGFLVPSPLGYGEPDELPILWFSMEQFWEPTAQAAILLNGEVVPLGMDETCRQGGGLVRFGLSPERLIPWPRLGKLANIPSSLRRALAEAAREQGAVPDYWLGIISGPLPLSEVEAIEAFDGKQWDRISQKGMRLTLRWAEEVLSKGLAETPNTIEEALARESALAGGLVTNSDRREQYVGRTV